MGKGNVDRRKTTLARVGNLEAVLNDLLDNLETERLFQRLAELETARESHERALEALVEGAESITARMADLEEWGGRARDSLGKLGHRVETRELWPWQRAGRKVKQWYKIWFSPI